MGAGRDAVMEVEQRVVVLVDGTAEVVEAVEAAKVHLRTGLF